MGTARFGTSMPGTSAITPLPRPLHAAIRSRRCSTGSRGWSVAGSDSTSSTTSPWRCRRGRCSRIRRTVPSSKPWSAFSTRWPPRSSSETMPDQHSVRPCCTCGTTVPTSSCAQSRPRTQPRYLLGRRARQRLVPPPHQRPAKGSATSPLAHVDHLRGGRTRRAGTAGPRTPAGSVSDGLSRPARARPSRPVDRDDPTAADRLA